MGHNHNLWKGPRPQPTLLYRSEAWTVYSRHLRAPEAHNQQCLWKILRIRWEDRRRNISFILSARCGKILPRRSKEKVHGQHQSNHHEVPHRPEGLGAHSSNKANWRSLVLQSSSQYNDYFHQAAEAKRNLKGEGLYQEGQTQHHIPCPHCTKITGSRFGLFTHLKTHKNQDGGQSYSTMSDC